MTDTPEPLDQKEKKLKAAAKRIVKYLKALENHVDDMIAENKDNKEKENND